MRVFGIVIAGMRARVTFVAFQYALHVCTQAVPPERAPDTHTHSQINNKKTALPSPQPWSRMSTIMLLTLARAVASAVSMQGKHL